jgi:hypothetical protein
MITGAPADLLLRVFTLDVVRMPQNPGVTQACLQPTGQNLDQSPQGAACEPFAPVGLWTPSRDTPAHWPLGRPEESLLRVLGTAVALTRPTSAIRRPCP